MEKGKCSPTKLARGNCLKGKNKGLTILLYTGSCCMYLKQESSVVLVVAINTYLQGHKWTHEFNFLVISERFVCVVWLCNVFCASIHTVWMLIRSSASRSALTCSSPWPLHSSAVWTPGGNFYMYRVFCTRKVVAYKYIIFLKAHGRFY